MGAEPLLVELTHQTLAAWGANMFSSTKEPTEGCPSAAQVRAPDLFSAFSGNLGVDLEVEIKTALIKAKQDNGTEIFLAFHCPANLNLESNGRIKRFLKEQAGVNLVGDLDRERALESFNSRLGGIIPVIERENRLTFEAVEKQFAEDPEIRRLIPEGRRDRTLRMLKFAYENPAPKHGELNPWTLVVLSEWTKETEEYKCTRTPIIHIVEESLRNRQGLSTTNEGSRFFSIHIQNTSKMFDMMEAAVKEHEIGTVITSRDMFRGRGVTHEEPK